MKFDVEYVAEESIPSTCEQISMSGGKLSFSMHTQSFYRREEDLNRDLEEIRSRVKGIVDEKTKIGAEFRELCDRNNKKISRNRDDIKKIDNQLAVLESKNVKITSNIKSHKVLSIEAFKISLKPLQDTADVIEKGKSTAALQLDFLQLERDEIIKYKDEKLQEFQIKSETLQDIEAQLKEVTEKVTKFKTSNVWEYKEIFEEQAILQKLNESKEKKKINAETLRGIELEIAGFDVEISRSAYEENADYVDIMIPELNRNQVELTQIEDYLNILSLKYCSPNLFEISHKVSLDHNKCTENWILSHQISFLEDHLMNYIEKQQTSEIDYKNTMEQLNSVLKRLESSYFQSVTRGEIDHILEEQLANTRKEVQVNKEEFHKSQSLLAVKITKMQEWIDTNRKYLVASDLQQIPEDSEIIEAFTSAFRNKMNNSELSALDSVISRFHEKARERNELYMKISTFISQSSVNVLSKYENIANIKALRKAKEIERDRLRAKNEEHIKAERKLIKSLESCKLEIESGRKALLNLLIFKENSVQKTNSAPKLSAEQVSIKEEFLQHKQEVTSTLKFLCSEETRLQDLQKSLSAEINMLKPQLKEFQDKISKKRKDIIKLEDQVILLEDSVEQIHSEITSLAGKKKEEMLLGVRKLARDHGGESSYKIEKLYQARSQRESDLFELEMEMIKNQKILSEKEVERSIEIMKLKAKQDLMEAELVEVKKKNSKNHVFLNRSKKDFKRFSSLDLNYNEILEHSEVVCKESVEEENEHIKIYKKGEYSPHSVDVLQRNHKTFDSLGYIERFSDISSEITLEPEPSFQLSSKNSSQLEKTIFSSISVLLEGQIIFKKFNIKSNYIFDPLEASVVSPESCGYSRRKISLNKQLTKLEIRIVGKPGVESSIMIDSIVAVSSLKLTSEMIKARKGATTAADSSLEALAKYAKDYSEMKLRGTIDYKSSAFIVQSKEATHFPFYLCLKSGKKAEFLSESLSDYLKAISALTSLTKNRSALEKLRFKIIQ